MPSPQAESGGGTASTAYRPGELLIKFRAGTTAERMAEINRRLGVEPITYDRRFFLLHAKIIGDRSVEEMVKRYAELPEVDYAEPNYLRRGMSRNP